MKSSNKKGDISFELILTISFVLIITIAIIVSYLFFHNRELADNQNSDIAKVYNRIIAQIRLDCQRAKSMNLSDNTLCLFDKNLKQISKYEIKDKNLVRSDEIDRQIILINGVESGYFGVKDNLPNLITVRIFPADKKEIPFFTSFALRGVNDVK